jgi:hypothetical protein
MGRHNHLTQLQSQTRHHLNHPGSCRVQRVLLWHPGGASAAGVHWHLPALLLLPLLLLRCRAPLAQQAEVCWPLLLCLPLLLLRLLLLLRRLLHCGCSEAPQGVLAWAAGP